MTPAEFSRPVRIDALSDAPHTIALAAELAECAALATRFGLIAIDTLTAEVIVRREGERVFAEGRVVARVVQPCVATGDPVPATIDEPFALRFVPAIDAGVPEEMELDADDLDTIDYAGGAIDLGEAVAETLALALDPFPRSADAAAVLRAAGVLSEEEAVVETSPFGKLKGLFK